MCSRSPRSLISSSREGSPAKLQRRLTGDLDNIVLMALRKEPQRRYPSVEQFAEEHSASPGSVAVTASKGSWRYRAGKFVTRHRAGVAATAAVSIALIAGVGATIRQARIARQQAEIARAERTRAERRFNDVRKLANSLIFEIHDSIQSLPGATPSRKLLLDRAVEYLDKLSTGCRAAMWTCNANWHGVISDWLLCRAIARSQSRSGQALRKASHRKAIGAVRGCRQGQSAERNRSTQSRHGLSVACLSTSKNPGGRKRLTKASPSLIAHAEDGGKIDVRNERAQGTTFLPIFGCGGDRLQRWIRFGRSATFGRKFYAQTPTTRESARAWGR